MWMYDRKLEYPVKIKKPDQEWRSSLSRSTADHTPIDNILIVLKKDSVGDGESI
jgi:hypothetical protein